MIFWFNNKYYCFIDGNCQGATCAVYLPFFVCSFFFVFTIETSQKDNYLRSVFIIVFVNLSHGPLVQTLGFEMT